MTKPILHPWLDTPQAVRAAHAAVRIPENKLPGAARAAGRDELFSEALAILTECALPPRERGHFVCAECGGPLVAVRAGAKFCSTPCRNRHGVRRHRGSEEAPPAQPKGHVGSMWSWPEAERNTYAAREIGLALCNYLRVRVGRPEVPATPWLERANVTASAGNPEDSAVNNEYLRALDNFETTGAIPWDLLDLADFDAIREALALCEPRFAA